jgi:hypothetical protein
LNSIYSRYINKIVKFIVAILAVTNLTIYKNILVFNGIRLYVVQEYAYSLSLTEYGNKVKESVEDKNSGTTCAGEQSCFHLVRVMFRTGSTKSALVIYNYMLHITTVKRKT